MAGDVNKSVEITLRANLKQLQSSLAQIPGMTKKEASQMTRALAAEFQKATKAANRAASESKKAAKATAQEYKKTSEKISESFNQQAQAAKRASNSMVTDFGRADDRIKATRRQTREMGAALGSLEDVVGAMSPELGALASEIGTLGQAARSASRALASGNIILIAAVVAITAVAGAYTLMNREQQKAKERFESFKDSLKESTKDVESYRQEIDALTSSLNRDVGGQDQIIADLEQSRLELRKVKGEISEQEFERLRLLAQQKRENIDLSNEYSKQRKDISERAEKAREAVKILNQEIQGLEKVKKGLQVNSKEELETTQLILERMAKRRELQEIIDRENHLLDVSRQKEENTNKVLERKQEIETRILKERQKQESIQKAALEAEKRRQKVVTMTASIFEKVNAIERESMTLQDALLSQQDQIKNTANERRENLDGQLETLKAEVEQLELTAKTAEEVAFAEEARLDLERASEAVKKAKAAITEQEKRDLEELNKKTEDLVKKQEKLSQIAALRVTLEDAALDAYLDTLPASQQLEAQEIRLALAKQDTIDKINEATEASLASAETQEERDMIAADRKKAMFAAEAGYIMELDKLREGAYQKQLQQTFEGTKVFLSGISSITTASLEMMEKSGSKNKKLVTALFLANKTAALGEIVMNTAKSITAAGAQFGPLAPLAIAGYVATAAAQSAIVMSQQPPKFHMGGMIEKTPDERVVVVKQGEAILDRATVNALGDQGVSRLQNGQGMSPEVIVMNPYKHFDRFIQDRARSGLSSSRSARRGY